VILDEPTFPGCHIHCRAVGMLAVSVGGEPEPKILAVPGFDERITWQELGDVPDLLLHELGQFFEIYKDLEPGKSSEVEGWRERDEAEREIEQARRSRVRARSG
jgi:inorganic pyrophosphatase